MNNDTTDKEWVSSKNGPGLDLFNLANIFHRILFGKKLVMAYQVDMTPGSDDNNETFD